MNRHEDLGLYMIRHIFGEKFELNTCLQDLFIMTSWEHNIVLLIKLSATQCQYINK